jgi:hypothetical protein
MKRLFIVLIVANLSLAACVVPTVYVQESGTPVAAQATAPAATPGVQPGLTPTLAPVASTPVSAAQSPPLDTLTPERPSMTLDADLNVRTGPGVAYERISWLAAGTRVDIIGRNAAGTWWQIAYPDAPDGKAWISGGYGTLSGAAGVPVVEAPPLPTPSVPTTTPTSPPPPAPPRPAYQYTPTGWYGDTNYGLTRFVGDIRDRAGNPVNGVFVRAACGSYSTISYPSGPVGWGPVGESSDWPPGFYDITVNTRPVPCMWTLQVVDTDDRVSVKAELSEAVQVEVTNEQSVIQANWQKNW